jgi:nucleotide-binding universal stress UspA family protein
MKAIHKILFPIDLTEDYQALFPWVMTFAKKFDATLYVLFVTQDLAEFSTFYVPHINIKSFQDEVMKSAQQKLNEVMKESFKDFPKVESGVAVGAPADKIVEAAKKEKANLIIMGTHGRKGIERTLFGSVADKVVRDAPCPVLCIHPGRD